jgi:osmotically inducible protein OsmC
MALSMILGKAGFTPKSIDTSAAVSLDKVDGGFAITAVHLVVSATVPGASEAAFADAANAAKEGCPVSKLLKADITLDASLAG